MRYFIKARKTVAYLSFQIGNVFATYLRKGEKHGAIRVHGKDATYQGSGWYKVALEPEYVRELLAAANYLIGRMKNFKMLSHAKPTEAVPQLADSFAFREGFFDVELQRTPRVLPVAYVSRNGHRVPSVLNRLQQASEGFASFLHDSLTQVIDRQLSQEKLRALQAKFSH